MLERPAMSTPSDADSTFHSADRPLLYSRQLMKVQWQVIFVLAWPDLARASEVVLPVKLRTVSQGRPGVDELIVNIKFR